MLSRMLDNVKRMGPRIHSITNFVTVNDCANVLLACGASPIMADDKEEVAEITSLCSGLNLNMGTLHVPSIDSMLIAGKRANELGLPVVLDPVGVGSSSLRRNTARRLLEEISFSVIRGNVTEIRALGLGLCSPQGVDALPGDQVTGENLEGMLELAGELSEKTGAVIALTGALDLVADEKKAYLIRNGHPMMRCVTGCGCQLSALTAAFVAANPSQALEASAAAVCTMGYAGEVAYQRLTQLDGNATYRGYIIDAIYRMTPESLEKGARYEIYERNGKKGHAALCGDGQGLDWQAEPV